MFECDLKQSGGQRALGINCFGGDDAQVRDENVNYDQGGPRQEKLTAEQKDVTGAVMVSEKCGVITGLHWKKLKKKKKKKILSSIT